MNLVSAQYTLKPVTMTERKMFRTSEGVRVSSVDVGAAFANGSAAAGSVVYVGLRRRW